MLASRRRTALLPGCLLACRRGAKGRAQRAFRRRAEEMEEEAAALEEEGLRKRRRTRAQGGRQGAGCAGVPTQQCRLVLSF